VIGAGARVIALDATPIGTGQDGANVRDRPRNR
jgi:hypothetical protein